MIDRAKRQSGGRLYLDAAREASDLGDRAVGTDHLILALLTDAQSEPAKALLTGLAAARRALAAIDERALRVAGIELRQLKPSPQRPNSTRLRMTPAAKAVFTNLRREAAGERLSFNHVLLRLLALKRPDPGAVLLDELGIDRDAVRLRLSAPRR
jgi:hypothetical protein